MLRRPLSLCFALSAALLFTVLACGDEPADTQAGHEGHDNDAESPVHDVMKENEKLLKALEKVSLTAPEWEPEKAQKVVDRLVAASAKVESLGLPPNAKSDDNVKYAQEAAKYREAANSLAEAMKANPTRAEFGKATKSAGISLSCASCHSHFRKKNKE